MYCLLNICRDGVHTYFINDVKGYKKSNHIVKVGDDNKSIQINKLTLNEFEFIFSNDEITDLQNKHILDYYPNSKQNRYPLFRKEIYMKYGIKHD